jgi:hypothetical protein
MTSREQFHLIVLTHEAILLGNTEVRRRDGDFAGRTADDIRAYCFLRWQVEHRQMAQASHSDPE